MKSLLIIFVVALVLMSAYSWMSPTLESDILEEAVYTPPPELLPLPVEEEVLEEMVAEEPEALPESVIHTVAFTPQAPFAQWELPLFQDACEESSVLMAARWVVGTDDEETLPAALATSEIERLGDVSRDLFDTFVDTSADDTYWILLHEIPGARAEVLETPGIEEMKTVLANDGILIVPMDGQLLENPYFTEPGPERHMLVVIGYDDETEEFITNDPGTRRGAGFRYNYENFFVAMRDYPTGNVLPITTLAKRAIAVYRDAPEVDLELAPLDESAEGEDALE